jgi:DNA-binding transcriptional regulator YhcF (GntR family)
MEWELSDDRPIFLQLYEQLARRIISGVYPPGSRLPSVRELAAESGVNPNTMQRALAQLEGSGLAESNRTSGRMVTSDTAAIAAMRHDLLRQAADVYLKAAAELGCTAADAAALLLEKEESSNG